MAFIQVDNLRRQYGQGEARVVALNDVSLTIDQGAFVAVMGSSGSGKSTLLHLLGGVDKPDAGRVIIDGTDLYTLSETELTVFRRRRIGLIYQFFNLVPELTVEENILLPQLLDGKVGDQQQLEELLAATGLSDRRRHLPSQLSGGQQQRVAIARALVTNPALVLADEPTANLDSQTAYVVIGLMKKMRDELGTTFIFSTHDTKIVGEAEVLFRLEDGRITDRDAKRGTAHA